MGKNKNKNKRKREKHAKQEKEKEGQLKVDGDPKKELENLNITELSSTESGDQHVRENWDDDDENWETVTAKKKKPRIKNQMPKDDENHLNRKEKIGEKPLDKNKKKSKKQKDDDCPDQDMEWENQEEASPNLGQPFSHRRENQREGKQNCSSHGRDDSRNHSRPHSAHRQDNKLHIKNKTLEKDQNRPKSMEINDNSLNKNDKKSKKQNDDNGPNQNMEWESREEASPNFDQPVPHREENRRERNQNYSSHGGKDSRNHSRSHSARRRDHSRTDNQNASFSDRKKHPRKQDQDPSSFQKDNWRQRYTNDSKRNDNNEKSSKTNLGYRNNNGNRSSYDAAGDSHFNRKEAQTRGDYDPHRKYSGPNDYQYRKTNNQNNKRQSQINQNSIEDEKYEFQPQGRRNNNKQNDKIRLNTRWNKLDQFDKWGNDNVKPQKKQKQPLFVPDAHKFEPTIREIEGDLFDSSEEYSLAHCVAEDLSMGAGIAVDFKKRFKGVEELRQQNKKTGEVAVLKKDNRFIFYLITKARSKGKPTIDSLTSALKSLKQFCLEFKVKKLAIPRIGCGLDRLDWGEVKDVLYQEFSSTDIEIVVYVW